MTGMGADYQRGGGVLSLAAPPRLTHNRPGFPWHCLAPFCLPGLVKPLFLVEDQVSAILEKHLILPFRPQKMESSLAWLTREQRSCSWL